MNIGFDTIGNAIIIAYDNRPVIVTDPWFDGSPYFGSWTLSHEIPAEQRRAIAESEYVWISHGHPDHLISDSLTQLRDKKILVPAHHSSRIYDGLREEGYDVHLLADNEWIQLSTHIRILCLCDWNQDATLVMDVNGKLVVNMNDSSAIGWRWRIRKIIREYPQSYYLRLYGGHADMENFFYEDGRRLDPQRQPQLGRIIARATERLGARYFIPFSSFHRMQRRDSAWIQPYLADIEDYATGYDSRTSEILPAFLRVDCERDQVEPINPAANEVPILAPEEFGDHWSDQLEPEEFQQLRDYFLAFEHLPTFLDFLRFKVGGKEYVVDLATGKNETGITFEAPRQSLMTSIKYEIFDDMLIGNFMKATLHGRWGANPLYPDFSPYVAKYGDNGRARTKQELEAYFAEYKRRMGVAGRLEVFTTSLETSSKNLFRSLVSERSGFYQMAKRSYHFFKRI